MAVLSDYYCYKLNKVLERATWLFFYITLIISTIFLILTLWAVFLNNPTVTSLESNYYSVSNVPFPGVAICNINKISKKRAKTFATYLANLTNTNESVILPLLNHIGNLYDFDFNEQNQQDILLLQTYLDTHNINVVDVTKELLTPCYELLHNCKWKSQLENCSEMFQMRLTFDGYCCTFNYKKRTSEIKNWSHLDEIPEEGTEGMEFGLSVTVDNNLDDYFYTTISSIGVLVHVFVPTDYPDKLSGSLIDVLAECDSEHFIEVAPSTVYSVNDVINYPVEKRNCLFDVERPTKFNGVYSQSDCNVDCRAEGTQDLCKCIPFMIPLSTPSTACNLQDLACLSQYKPKWSSMYPIGYTRTANLRAERQNALKCENYCYPSCGGTLYNVMTETAKLHNKYINSNDTIIHVYYTSRFIDIYKQDVIYYWFEILSNFGGIFGLVIGFSLISVIELIVYVMQKCFIVNRNYIKTLFLSEQHAAPVPEVIGYKQKRVRKSPVYTEILGNTLFRGLNLFIKQHFT